MTTKPLPHRGAIASETSRRQTRLLRWTLLGMLLLAVNLWLADTFVRAELFTHVFHQTVLLAVPAYLLAAWILYRVIVVPVAEGGEMVFVATLIPFLLLILLLAIVQQPYSRAAVLLMYLTTSLWFWAGYRLHVRRYRLRLAVSDAATLARLRELVDDAEALRGVELTLLDAGDASAGDPATPARNACDAAGPQAAIDDDATVPFDGVIVGHPSGGATLAPLITRFKRQHVRLYSVEKVAELLTGRMTLSQADAHFIDLDDAPSYELVKRAIDIGAVLLLMPLTLPVAALVAMAVRLDSPGPALYSQMRVGRNGVPFRIWKFRSMRVESPEQGRVARFASSGDPRITRLGHALRKYRFDELPQLYNVLRGDMSLIGPRPEQEALVREFSARIPCYPYRHLVRPGLSGWAQVRQGYAASEDETAVKLSHDLYYVTHYSLALDLLIAFKTLRTIATGFGAR